MIQLIPRWFSEEDTSLPLPLALREGARVIICSCGSSPNRTVLSETWIQHTLAFTPVQTPSCWTAAKLSYEHKIQIGQ